MKTARLGARGGGWSPAQAVLAAAGISLAFALRATWSLQAHQPLTYYSPHGLYACAATSRNLKLTPPPPRASVEASLA